MPENTALQLLGIPMYMGLVMPLGLLFYAIERWCFARAGRLNDRARAGLLGLAIAFPFIAAVVAIGFGLSPGLESAGLAAVTFSGSLVTSTGLLLLSRNVMLAASPMVAACIIMALDARWGPNPSGHHHAMEAGILIWFGIVGTTSVIWGFLSRPRAVSGITPAS